MTIGPYNPLTAKDGLVVYHTLFKKKASKPKSLLANFLNNEAEGTRTLNLRIDSPML